LLSPNTESKKQNSFKGHSREAKPSEIRKEKIDKKGRGKQQRNKCFRLREKQCGTEGLGRETGNVKKDFTGPVTQGTKDVSVVEGGAWRFFHSEGGINWRFQTTQTE